MSCGTQALSLSIGLQSRDVLLYRFRCAIERICLLINLFCRILGLIAANRCGNILSPAQRRTQRRERLSSK
ncbi:hypothetical protein [Bradyrhizobium sp. 2TAF36]|uniref:hypothetical protein n=1 Tax=Bradyrhizobium sp. 2TAF36 TaxID=3233016 RepID=UPI003F9234D2